MWSLQTDDIDAGWAEVRRRMARLRKVHDHGRYVTERPGTVEGSEVKDS
jgi:hypothetical protein